MKSLPEEARNFAIHLMQHLVVPTFVLDAECRVVVWNRACERLTGVPAPEVLGTREHWRAFYDEPRPCLADLVVQKRMEELEGLYVCHQEPGSPIRGYRAENWCVMPRLGSELYLAIDAGPIYDPHGRLMAVVETLRDMTEHQRAREALARSPALDANTGVANRPAFDAKLSNEWRRERRDSLPLSLLLVEMKGANGAHGDATAGDPLRLMAEATTRLVYRPGDQVAHFASSSLAVVLPETDLEGAETVAQRILDGMDNAVQAGGEAIEPAVRIGVATAVPTARQQPDTLVLAAESALSRARTESGRPMVTVLAAGTQGRKSFRS
ncbi:MAG TPA: diguanylate cyclase [Rhodocyclaceae bacterium]|nr:diguanylate cyclase [Rhodocyclaceae bacterium]HNH34637.1 diguanylate cyclase [Rhodocyclaceae bacterium]